MQWLLVLAAGGWGRCMLVLALIYGGRLMSVQHIEHCG
jgi:hypothetical protein